MTYNLEALPWDIAILVMIGGGIALEWYAIAGWRGKVRFLKSHLALVFAVVAQIGWGIVFYGSFIEPHMLTVTEYDIELPIEEELTVVALSDFHVGPYKGKRFVKRVVDRVNALRPDLVLLAGDFIYYGSDPLNNLTPLQNLQARYGVFGVLGNHEYGCGSVFFNRDRRVLNGFDYSSRVMRTLERVDVTVLRNSWREIRADGLSQDMSEEGILYIGGVDDACIGNDDIGEALPPIQHKAPVILLAHNPDIILDNRATYAHLIVSGHTHGGQIRLPFIGPLSQLPTQLGRSYDQGLFEVDGNSVLAITRGVGESGARSRLFAPPEILVLRTKSS